MVSLRTSSNAVSLAPKQDESPDTKERRDTAQETREGLHGLQSNVESSVVEKMFSNLLVYFIEQKLTDDVQEFFYALTGLEGIDDLKARFAHLRESNWQESWQDPLVALKSALFIDEEEARSESEKNRENNEVVAYCIALLNQDNISTAYEKLYKQLTEEGDQIVEHLYPSIKEIQKNGWWSSPLLSSNHDNSSDNTDWSKEEQTVQVTGQQHSVATHAASESNEALDSPKYEFARNFIHFIDQQYTGKTSYHLGGKNPDAGSCDCSWLVYGALKKFCKLKGVPCPDIGTYSSMQREKTEQNTKAVCSSSQDVAKLNVDDFKDGLHLVTWKSDVTKYVNLHGTGVHHVGFLDPIEPFVYHNGEKRLNILECTPSRGVHRKNTGTNMSYVNQRSSHRSDLHITEIPLSLG